MKISNFSAAPTTPSVPPEQSPNSDAQQKKYVEPPKSEPQRSKWLSKLRLPENVGLNSGNNFTLDARSQHPHPKRVRRRRRRKGRFERLKQWLKKRTAKLFCVDVGVFDSNLSGSRPQPKKSATGSIKSTESERYIRTFKLELIDKQDNPVVRNVQVLLDTGNPKNILSTKMVSLFDLGLEDDGERVALKTIGNNEWLSIGRIKGRFILRHHDPSWIDAEFEVSKFDEHYDAVLGSKTLNEYNIIQVSEDVPHGFSGFRGKSVSYTSKLFHRNGRSIVTFQCRRGDRKA